MNEVHVPCVPVLPSTLYMKDSNVQAFIAQQPLFQKHILSSLRMTILHTGLRIAESIKYGIPFYDYCGQLCFLNPKKEVVLLGLCKGAFLSNEQGLLEGEGKEVRHIRIKRFSDIHPEVLQTLLHEAMLLNEHEHQRVKKL